MTFEIAVEHVLRHEGGYVNHPNDPGGETQFGISKRAYPHLEIKSLNRAAAIAIYKHDYWDRMKCDELPPLMRLIVFDCAVNQGPGAAATMLEQALMAPEKTFQTFADLRLTRYCRNKNFETFGHGWTRRLLNIVIVSMQEFST